MSTKLCYKTPHKTACGTCCLHKFRSEKGSYSTFSAYLCIASEILCLLSIETNKDVNSLILTQIRQVLATYNDHILC